MSGPGFTHSIAGGSGVLITTALKSPNYAAGSAGWQIGKDGSAEFNDIAIRAKSSVSGSSITIAPSGDTSGATDTSNLKAAFNDYGAVMLATGQYYLNDGLVISQDGFSFTGDGWESQLIPVSGSNFDVLSNTLTLHHVTVGNMRIDGSNMSGTTADEGNLMHFRGARYWNIFDIYCDNGYPNWALILDEDSNSNVSYNNAVRRIIMNNGAAGIYAKNTEADEIYSCLFQYAKSSTAAQQNGTTAAYMLWTPAGDMDIYGNVFGSLGGFTTPAILAENGIGSRISHNRFDTCPYQAIHTTAGSNVITGNSFVDCCSAGSGVPVILLGSGANVVTGNTFRHLNTVEYTYGAAEASAYTGNLFTGNVIYEGTSGWILVNAGSTGTVNADNSEL